MGISVPIHCKCAMLLVTRKRNTDNGKALYSLSINFPLLTINLTPI